MKNLSKNDMKTGRIYDKIFNIKLNSTSKERVLTFVRDSLARRVKFRIFTPNPEIVIQALKDQRFLETLNSSDLSVPDGIGLAQASKFLEMKTSHNKLLRFIVCLPQGLKVGYLTLFDKKQLFASLNIIRGRELFMDLVKLANKKGWKVFFLGGMGDVAEKTGKNLQESLKTVKIATDMGPILNREGNPINEKEIEIEKKTINKINEFSPQLLFVAFGAPKQERWVTKWLSKLNIGGAMVIGGTFDYYSKKMALPPTWMEEAGLEWIWRLIQEPRRIKRIFQAWPVFPLKVFWNKVTS